MNGTARILVLALSGASAFALLWLSAPVVRPREEPCHDVEAHHGVVVTVSGPASDIGVAILKRGGNALDAAVATAFALAASYPAAGNLGGGGYMLVHPAPGAGETVAFDYRETAPAAAWRTMFSRNDTQYSHRAVAVPGTVRGLALAHRRFGNLQWAELLAPAAALARDGFVLDRNLVDSLNQTLAAAPEFREFQRVFGKPGGGSWRPGDRLRQPDLARTLDVLAEQGPDAFYQGAIAQDIVAEMNRGKGLITAKDLADYRPIERKPLHTRYRDAYDVYVPPPPSSGGVVLLEELHMIEIFDLKSWGRWSPLTLHVMAEAMRRANHDRALYLGDPAFVSIPARLTTREYGHKLAKTIDLRKAGRSEPPSSPGQEALEGKSTTHFSVIDRNGMAVANTYTLERRWGSRVVVTDRGFLLNNDMWAFNLFSGVTDTKGMIGTGPNTIAPGKRMLTSQTPTIVAKDGNVRLVTGSPGSRAIPHTILGILVSVLDFGIPIREAVDAPRLSHEWFPDHIVYETPERYPEIVKALRECGHVVVRHWPLPQGDAHSIWVPKPGTYVGAADRRLNGKAAGY